ncbi:site-specific integrase [Candidatus Marsarchaeota archaeon]|nr:site-specific integrase [Candidatus Marsarchaeota archaeon]
MREVEAQLERISHIKWVSGGNMELARKYADRLLALDRNPRTISKHIYYLRRILELSPAFDFSRAKREDFEKLLLRIKRLGVSAAAEYDYKKVLKSFMKQEFGDGVMQPAAVQWIKLSTKDFGRITPSDVLRPEEVLLLIEAAGNSRDRALISLGFEAGLRSGEVVNMRVRDVDLVSQQAWVTVSGKTGMRRIPIFGSALYIARYLDDCRPRLKPDDWLWQRLVHDRRAGRLEAPGMNAMLKKVAREAGLAKPKGIWWHLLRHSSATYNANRLNEEQLRNFYGWAKGSQTPSLTYVHMAAEDVANALRKANGLKAHEAWERSLPVKECPRCMFVNTTDARFCSRCGSALDVNAAFRQGKDETTLERLFVEWMKNHEDVRNCDTKLPYEKRRTRIAGNDSLRL